MVKIPRFRLREASVFSRQVQTRMPFRFGRATLTQMPILHLRLRVEADDGQVVTGISACGLPPLWFDKGASKTHADNIQDLSISLRLALEHYLSMDDAPVWQLHKSAEPEIRKVAAAKGLNELTAGFGIAQVDLALIDAACRHAHLPFHAALKHNLLGFGEDLAAMLPPAPLERVAARHTVGLLDPILSSEIAEPVGDGLPESLEDVASQYRVGYYKIKISGDAAATRERLGRIASVLDARAGDYRATIDGNEQFRDMGEFASFIGLTKNDPALRELWRRTLWIEQPVERHASLDDSVAAPLKEIAGFKPVIIDESDGSDEAVDRAFALGYAGTSAKNCKGIFRTLHSYRRIHELQSQGERAPVRAILSSEDLTNAPVVPLHQDLCVAGALGIPHCERNGHHYVIGFKFLTEKEQADALREYPSIYRLRNEGPPVVRIEDGCIDLREINRHAFGTFSEPDWDNLEPVRLPEIPADLIEEQRSVP